MATGCYNISRMSDHVDFQALFKSLPGRHLVMLPDDPDFTIVAENDAHIEVAMVQPGQVIGKPFLEAFPDTSEDFKATGENAVIRSFRNVIRTGKTDTMPPIRYDIADKNGKLVPRYWQASHLPIFDDHGKLAFILQDTRDITQEMTADTSLKQAKQQLDQALSSGLIGTWLWDVQKDIVIGDKYMSDMFGVDPVQAAAGLPLDIFTEAIHPDDRGRVTKSIAASLKSGKVFSAEYRTTSSEGAVHWLLASGKVERDENGNAVRFPGVLVDITDRKINELNLSFLAGAGAILSSSLDYRKTLQRITELAVPDIADWCTVDILDEHGKLQLVGLSHKDPGKVRWAKELRRQQGPPEMDSDNGTARVVRTGKAEFYPEISDEMLVASAKSKKELKLLRDLGLSSAITVPLIINDQSVGAITFISAEQKRHYSPADLEMAQALADRASIAMTNAFLYDDAQRELAARKELEEQLRLANEQLEQRVGERTAQLNETNLNLQRSNQELQDFAYVASHDLQEPLRKIQAFGNLLEAEYAEKLGDGRDYLVRMRSAAARMSALIEDILSFSRVTTKAREFKRVDLDGVVQGVLEDLETRIDDTGATIELGKLPAIDADAMQMRQLLQNLISNALKFQKPGVKPVVKISAIKEISQTSHRQVCTLTVEDNGVGFEEKYLDRIFAVFQRLHGRDTYEGTGIGLAVCRKIAERHGGSITARSKPGRGSAFIITLPIHHKKQSVANEQGEPA